VVGIDKKVFATQSNQTVHHVKKHTPSATKKSIPEILKSSLQEIDKMLASKKIDKEAKSYLNIAKKSVNNALSRLS